MRHLRIKPIGYLQTVRSAPWSRDPYEPATYEIDKYQEPILSVEIDKQTWDAMFDLYEAHLNGHKHPAIRDAWEQYQMTLHLCGDHHFAGNKKI